MGMGLLIMINNYHKMRAMRNSFWSWSIELIVGGLLACAVVPATACANAPCVQVKSPATLRIVAAENFYGDIARQIAGPGAQIDSILENPGQDPHLFEASPSTARRLSAADLVIYNGLGYDPWMEKMLPATAGTNGSRARKQIAVAALVAHRPDDNPHLWYDLAHVRALARTIAAALKDRDAVQAPEIDGRLLTFEKSLDLLQRQIAELRKRYQGTPVTATEPVFGYMADAIGLSMRHLAYQRAIMNETEPAPSEIIALEQDLTNHRVAVLFFNVQASGRAAQRAKKMALANGIPLVGVSETMPLGSHYQDWMAHQLDALAVQLNAPVHKP